MSPELNIVSHRASAALSVTLLSLSVLFCTTEGRAAPSAACSDAGISGFIPAKIERNPSPRYPKNALIDYNEGWVLLEYVVAKDGTIRDPVLRDAMGPSDLIDEAMRVVPTWKFMPATRGGVSVDEYRKRTEIVYRYESGTMSPTGQHDYVVVYVHPASPRLQASTHDGFARPFKRGNDLYNEKKYAEAIQVFEALLGERLNLYERSRASLALAMAYSELGDYARAFHYSGHATIRNAENLEQRRRADALALRMKLAIQNGAFAEAACVFEVLSSVDAAAAAPGTASAKMMTAINAVVGNAAPLEIPAKLAAVPYLGEPAGWQHRMLRTNFSFSRVQEGVKTFRLTCTGTVLEAAVDDEQQWNIPPLAGTCVLRVTGTPGSAFTLVEE